MERSPSPCPSPPGEGTRLTYVTIEAVRRGWSLEGSAAPDLWMTEELPVVADAETRIHRLNAPAALPLPGERAGVRAVL
jgi:hypothetical protein